MQQFMQVLATAGSELFSGTGFVNVEKGRPPLANDLVISYCKLLFSIFSAIFLAAATSAIAATASTALPI